MAEVEISFERSRIDLEKTSALIRKTYWGESRSLELDDRAFAHSICAGAYLGGEQIGFGRVLTDYAYLAYLSDVIVWPEHRGKGVGLKLVGALLDHPDLAAVGVWSLRTSDAHGLYEKFGFSIYEDGRTMRRVRGTAA